MEAKVNNGNNIKRLTREEEQQEAGCFEKPSTVKVIRILKFLPDKRIKLSGKIHVIIILVVRLVSLHLDLSFLD